MDENKFITKTYSDMEPIAEGDKGVYLYIACYNNDTKKTNGFIAVTKAMLYDEVAIEMENLGDHAIIFTSILPVKDIREKLNHNKSNYLLIDLSISYDLESVFGFLPESEIEMIKKMTDNKFSTNKPALKRKLDEAIEKENFELAAPLRDLKKR